MYYKLFTYWLFKLNPDRVRGQIRVAQVDIYLEIHECRFNNL